MNIDALVNYIDTIYLHGGTTEHQLMVLEQLHQVIEAMLDEKRATAVKEGVIADCRDGAWRSQTIAESMDRNRIRKLAAYGCYQ